MTQLTISTIFGKLTEWGRKFATFRLVKIGVLSILVP